MNDYYVQVADDNTSISETFWSVDLEVAHQGIEPSQLGTHYAEPGEEMIVTLRKRFPTAQFHKLQLAPGEYFPRMARPNSTLPECSPGHNPDDSAAARNIRTTSTGQLHALIQQMQEICKTVHPIEANFPTYGHQIRNIIILASTEVETHWKNILKANGAPGRCTKHYVRLLQPMKLAKYRVTLSWYPWLEPLCPFEDWVPDPPTQSLTWYNAYNNIKHDRENCFAHATLINALQSLAGCFVMLCAQYGWDFARKGEVAGDAFFRLIEAPEWQASEIYVPPIGSVLKPICHPELRAKILS